MLQNELKLFHPKNFHVNLVFNSLSKRPVSVLLGYLCLHKIVQQIPNTSPPKMSSFSPFKKQSTCIIARILKFVQGGGGEMGGGSRVILFYRYVKAFILQMYLIFQSGADFFYETPNLI